MNAEPTPSGAGGKPLAVITGVGPGTGAALVRRFRRGGDRVAMLAAGSGAILVTDNTASQRGRANFAGFAPTKAPRRILAESMARELGPPGIHVACLLIDAVIDVTWARQRFSDQPDDFFIRPADIADELWNMAHQPRSAGSFLTELRPFNERW